MDLTAIWPEVTRFQEQALVTTGGIHTTTEEHALVTAFLQVVPLEALFACLQDAGDRNSAKQVQEVCSCIDRVLSDDSEGAIFFQPEIIPFIHAGLYHVKKQVCVLTLNQLKMHLSRTPTLEQVNILANSVVLKDLCDILTDEDVDIAAKASNVLEMFSRFSGGEFYKPILDALKFKSQSSDIAANSVEFMRCLETAAKICEQDDLHMGYAIATNVVDIILQCLKSDDPLFVMNVIDLIPKLCNTKTGVQHMFGSGTLQVLLRLSEDPFVGGSAIRLIGEITATAAKLNVTTWNSGDPVLLRAFMSTIMTKIQSSDALQQIAGTDALAAFCCSSDKELHLLLQHESICKQWLQLGSSMKMPVKANCFLSLARILENPTQLQKQPNQIPVENAGIWGLHERLFNSLGMECRRQPTMQFLMESLKQPFEELRVAVFTLLRAVAAQNNEWGIRTMLSYGGFFEFLMDRNTEPTKETREWKFAVADAVMASPFQAKLDDVTLAKLKDHIRKGPYMGAAPANMELEAA